MDRKFSTGPNRYLSKKWHDIQMKHHLTNIKEMKPTISMTEPK